MSERDLGALHQPKEETRRRCGTTAASPTGSAKDCLANYLESCVKSSKCWRSRKSKSDISGMFPHALWFESHSQNQCRGISYADQNQEDLNEKAISRKRS